MKVDKKSPVCFVQGPLAGISCAPFRHLAWQYSRPLLSYTEMISCNTLINAPAQLTKRYLYKNPHEGPVGFQLSGNEPNQIALATKIVTDHGADAIDLNCGCPVNKIRSKHAGSSHLANPKKLFQLIQAMKSNTHLPVSIKIRVDGNSSDKYNQEIARVVQDAGVDFLVVHGRHWQENYATPCHYSQIQYFVEALTIPVIGNGDIASADSLSAMLNTGCAGVMISRACVGQPWLIQKLMAEMKGDKFTKPNINEIGSIFLSHIVELASLLNSDQLAILQARKFGKYYARDMRNKERFITQLNHCETIKEMKRIIDSEFK